MKPMNIPEREEFLECAKPLIEWLNNCAHPHCTVLVTQTSATLVETICHEISDEYVKD